MLIHELRDGRARYHLVRFPSPAIVSARRAKRGRSRAGRGSIVTVLVPHTGAHTGGSVAEWLACSAQAQKGPGSNHSRDAVG